LQRWSTLHSRTSDAKKTENEKPPKKTKRKSAGTQCPCFSIRVQILTQKLAAALNAFGRQSRCFSTKVQILTQKLAAALNAFGRQSRTASPKPSQRF
jgi:hypothetical protein